VYGRKRIKHIYVYQVPNDRTLHYRSCGKPLKPHFTTRWEGGSTEGKIIATFTGHYGYEGNDYFCTLRCAYRFANAVARKAFPIE
jgi:hypothetical protein